MTPIRVLVVDDDPFTRDFITSILASDGGIEVVGQAGDGASAVRQVAALKPDLVTMDINMPGMNGVEAIRRIMAAHAVPILVVTSQDDANTAYAAISGGALEVMPKPDPDRSRIFINKIKLLAKVRVIPHIRGEGHRRRPGAGAAAAMPPDIPSVTEMIVAVASSTGGPRALATLLSALPAAFPAPIVIAQHITDNFAAGMADWLNGLTPLTVKTGDAGERPAAGTVYLAPSGVHIDINRWRRIRLGARSPGDIYYPSGNRLLTSAAEVYGDSAIGVVLTGMGDDGTAGIRRIKAAGGATIAQDEATSVIFGMPRMAIQSGCVDHVLPISEIPARLIRLIGKRGRRRPDNLGDG